MDERRLSLLRDLERALLEALSESADVHRSLERMHGEGYTLQLFLDCHRETASAKAAGRAGGESRSGEIAESRSRESGAGGDGGEPIFRINSGDLQMLRALGIDPTRKGRARR